MKQLISLLFIVFCFSCSKSQDSTFKFVTNRIDVGELRVTDKIAPIRFVGINNSRKEVSIDSVLTNCDCFKPILSKRKIAKGDSLIIELPFEPINKTGVIKDVIKLVSQKDTIELQISGLVRAETKADLSYNFTERIGECVLVANRAVNFREILKNEMKIEKIRAYNSCERPIILKNVKTPHKHLNISFVDSIIPPKSFFSWDIKIEPSLLDNYGFRSDKFNLSVLKDSTFEYSVSANSILIYDFKIDTLQKPIFKVDKSIKEFNQVKSGQIISETYKIKNVGKSDLKLLKISPTCKCVLVDHDSTTVKPNDEFELKVTFDTNGRSGYQRKTIVILTNDPIHPYIQLQLNGKVTNH